MVEGQSSVFTSISELKQTEALLNTLESRLYHFQQILPRLSRRQGLMDFGGTVLQTLFGTSTVAILHQFHETLNELQSSDSDIVYSLSSQVAYIKKLEPTTVIIANVIVNLSNIVKEVVVHLHNMFQQITRYIYIYIYILWLMLPFTPTANGIW